MDEWTELAFSYNLQKWAWIKKTRQYEMLIFLVTTCRFSDVELPTYFVYTKIILPPIPICKAAHIWSHHCNLSQILPTLFYCFNAGRRKVTLHAKLHFIEKCFGYTFTMICFIKCIMAAWIGDWDFSLWVYTITWCCYGDTQTIHI